MREKLIKILRVPIFPHELVDPTEAVADYLLDNDVVPVVRCKDCKHMKITKVPPIPSYCTKHNKMPVSGDDYCSFGERNTDAESH